MGELSVGYRDNLSRDGFHIERNYFDKSYIKKLDQVSNAIISLDRKGNYIGLGNRSDRNGIVVSGNILSKHNCFIDLLLNQSLLDIPRKILGEFCLSEYKIISSYSSESFQYWWHRDHPYQWVQEGEEVSVLNVGILIPCIDFKLENGPTVIIPGSHRLTNRPLGLHATESYKHEQCVGTSQGDIFVYHGNLWHSGTANRSGVMRNLISMHFVKKYLTPCEDMSLQYFQLQIDNVELKSLMTGYHVPHVNKFGANRGWVSTVWWLWFLRYPFWIMLNIKRVYWRLRRRLYRAILSIFIDAQ